MRLLLVLLALSIVTVCQSLSCDSEIAERCSTNAFCDLDVVPNLGCFCPEGWIGNGCDPTNPSNNCGGTPGCLSESWTARATFDVTGTAVVKGWDGKIVNITIAAKQDWAQYLFGSSPTDFHALSAIHHELSSVWIRDSNNNKVEKLYLSINMLYASPNLAQGGAQVFNNRASSDYATNIQPYVYNGTLVQGFPARVYRWQAESTSKPISVDATGMTVDSVVFQKDCKLTGCWVIDVTYTTGKQNRAFNTFYLPRVQDDQGAGWQEDFSYDVDWTQQLDATNKARIWNTQYANKFPCGENVDKTWWQYNIAGAAGTTNVPQDGYQTSCCIPNFVANYRVVEGFETYFANACTNGNTADVIDSTFLESEYTANIDFPVAEPFLDGAFSDINAHVEYLGPLDIYILQHRARVFIDEEEMRRKAGFLTGTVGVEYTVDTFLGLANFKPTSSWLIDMAASSVAIHLEKTNFFSVSTHGTNDYTFLEYVNLRLVTVYKEDVVFGGETEDGIDPMKVFGTNFYQTSSEESADYLQVTFTMGSQYSPNMNGAPFDGGLIPLASVLAGKGTFASDAEMEHKCVRYMHDASDFWLPTGSDTPGGGDLPPSGRRAVKTVKEEAAAGDSGRKLLQDNDDALKDEVTWGPLDSCHEQSRCMYMEFNKVEPSCNTGDCDWEVCMVFNAGHDVGCKVYLQCEPYIQPETLRCEIGQLTTAGQFEPGPQQCEDLSGCYDDNGDLQPLPYYVYQAWPDVSRCTADMFYPCGEGAYSGLQDYGPGDYNEESNFGNLFMWCDKTTSDCPADTNYPAPEIEYFEPVPRYNISQQERQCQRGKPGQKVFFCYARWRQMRSS